MDSAHVGPAKTTTSTTQDQQRPFLYLFSWLGRCCTCVAGYYFPTATHSPLHYCRWKIAITGPAVMVFAGYPNTRLRQLPAFCHKAYSSLPFIRSISPAHCFTHTHAHRSLGSIRFISVRSEQALRSPHRFQYFPAAYRQRKTMLAQSI